MDFEKTENLLKNAISIKLLRAKNAALIISFLHKEFKDNNNLSIKTTDLALKLVDYLEFINYLEIDNESGQLFQDYFQAAKNYIDDWSDQGYLIKYYDDKGNQINELTSSTEKSLQWILSLEKKEFIGTESRFKDIFFKIKELVEQSNEDPEKRIEELEKRKKEIDDEINMIKETKIVRTFDSFQIKSRFNEINKLSKELLSDFREVQENFKEIVKGIYQKETNTTKGNILKYTFEAIDKLRSSEQGKSFYSFWDFLINEASQQELNLIIEDLYNLLKDKGIEVEDKFLRKIEKYLYASGIKVIENNNLLAQKLTKVIAEKDILERKRIRETISDIKELAIKLINSKHRNEYISIETLPEIFNFMERPLTENIKVKQSFDRVSDLNEEDVENIDMSKIYSQFYIDEEILLKRINTLLIDKTQITLDEVIEHYPISKGLSEILSYISLVRLSDKYYISDSNIYSPIEFDRENKKYIEIPQVIYSR